MLQLYPLKQYFFVLRSMGYSIRLQVHFEHVKDILLVAQKLTMKITMKQLLYSYLCIWFLVLRKIIFSLSSFCNSLSSFHIFSHFFLGMFFDFSELVPIIFTSFLISARFMILNDSLSFCTLSVFILLLKLGTKLIFPWRSWKCDGFIMHY